VGKVHFRRKEARVAAGTHRGFTLLELLVAITIIGVLLALLTPAYYSVQTAHEHSRCTRNLGTLGQALGMRRSDSALGGKSDIRPVVWPAQALPYLEYRGEYLLCPVVAGLLAEGIDRATAESGGEAVGGEAVSTIETPDAEPVNNVPLSELVELCLGGSTYVQMEPGVWVVKLSDEQYQAARSTGLLGGDGTSNDLRNRMDTTFQPGSSGVYWLCFEDQIQTGGDKDFNDVMVRVEQADDGSYRLTLSGHTGGGHSIVSKPEHQTLLVMPRGQYYVGVDVIIEPPEIEDEAPGGGPGVPPTDPADEEAEGSTSIVYTNYAMNADYPYLTYSAGRILLMDYCKYLAHRTDVWTDPDMDPNGDGVPRFARHWGEVNVLLTDGAVVGMDPAEINPMRPDAQKRYWDP
jgi:prepilin-type N-terminal cleavage/methylation domain-containing protein